MFRIEKIVKKRRIGILKTKSGEIDSPFFMPDATRGFVRSMSKADLEKIGISPMVVNTYHLFLQPGIETIKKSGGIHNFMDWKAPLLSDSGGYQVFSLIHKNPKMGKITDKKVIFKSPLDGRKHELTPRKAIQIQFNLGVDMIVCLDDPPPNDYSREKIEKAVQRTIAWAKICKDEYEKQVKKRKLTEKNRPLLFCVVQGGVHFDLRKQCTEALVKIGFDGYGFGARHVDKEGNFLEEILRLVADLIPENSLRFALGIGTPEDIVKCADMGWDMFDCVIPTREGRHGKLFIWKKKNVRRKDFYTTININNEKYRNDFTPVDAQCGCYACKNHTKAFLNHLMKMKDPLFFRLASIHNLNFYVKLMKILQK
jgi:queuine tRNA-ribosyltransferase